MKRKDMISFACITCYIALLCGGITYHLTGKHTIFIETANIRNRACERSIDQQKIKRIHIDNISVTDCKEVRILDTYFVE